MSLDSSHDTSCQISASERKLESDESLQLMAEGVPTKPLKTPRALLSVSLDSIFQRPTSHLSPISPGSRKTQDFYRSVCVSLVLTGILTILTQIMDYSWWRLLFPRPLRTLLILFAIANNSYQVMTHLLTTLKFSGWNVPMIPGGAKDDQSVIDFTLHNQLDLWGWFSYFLARGQSNWLYSFLAATHMAVGLIPFYRHDVFQEFYIRTTRCSRFFHQLKTSFVFLDAASRTYALTSWCLGW
jgi:hypothetical protein